MTFGFAGAQRQHGLGAFQGLNLALLIDAKHQGVFRRTHVESNHITHLVHVIRVGGNLKGLRPMRLKAKCSPDARYRVARNAHFLAIFRVLQCVAALGLLCRVFSINSCNRSSPMVRGGPLRGISLSPSSRICKNRFRSVPTVALQKPIPAAISVLAFPSAIIKTAFARLTSLIGALLLRASSSRNFLSSLSSSISATGRPRRFMP